MLKKVLELVAKQPLEVLFAFSWVSLEVESEESEQEAMRQAKMACSLLD